MRYLLPKIGIPAFALATQLGCQAELKTHMAVSGSVPAESSAPAPAEQPHVVEPADGLSLDRTFVQTRSVISVVFNADALQAGQTFTLTDDTTGQVLMSGPTIADAAAGLTDVDGGGVQLLAAGSMLVKLYPGSPSLHGKLAYGLNSLTLSVDGTGEDADSRASFTLHDFTTMGQAITVFDAGAQRVDGFEGWDPGMGQLVVVQGASTLMNNPQNIIDN